MSLTFSDRLELTEESEAGGRVTDVSSPVSTASRTGADQAAREAPEGRGSGTRKHNAPGDRKRPAAGAAQR